MIFFAKPSGQLCCKYLKEILDTPKLSSLFNGQTDTFNKKDRIKTKKVSRYIVHMQWTIYQRLHGTLITLKPVSVSGHQKVLKYHCWKIIPEWIIVQWMPRCSCYSEKNYMALYHHILCIHKMLGHVSVPGVIKKYSWDARGASYTVAELAGQAVYLSRLLMYHLLYCIALFPAPWLCFDLVLQNRGTIELRWHSVI